jgi:hypothetical protein
MTVKMSIKDAISIFSHVAAHRTRQFWRRVKRQLPDLNFITLHYLYFIGTCLLTAIIFWGSSTPARSVPFTDSIFFTVSAMTEAGLNTINLSTLNTFQQIILFILILMGSSIFVSISVVHVRRKAFEHRFRREQRIRHTLSKASTKVNADEDRVLPASPTGRLDLQSSLNVETENQDGAVETPHQIAVGHIDNDHVAEALAEKPKLQQDPPSPRVQMDRIRFSSDTRHPGSKRDNADYRYRPRLLGFTGVGARSDLSSRRMSLQSGRPLSTHSQAVNDDIPQLQCTDKSFMPNEGFVGRNSAFHGLSYSERERLGGAEYKAVVFLSWVVPLYFFLWQFLSCLSCGGYINRYHSDIARQNGLNPW